MRCGRKSTRCAPSTRCTPPERNWTMMLSGTNRQRGLVALVQVLALGAWFSATAIVPTLRLEWGIGATAAVWLTASVQIGFVAGAIASTVINLPDRTTPQHLLARSTARGRGLASLGYFGHMWELYAQGTWLPMFVVSGRAARGDPAAGPTGFIAFGSIGVAGAVGCLLGGWASDRFGRPPAA